jgi:hypothetical protein
MVKDRMSAEEYRKGAAKVPAEFEECCWLTDWARATRWRGRPIAEVLIHVPNGGFFGVDRTAAAVIGQKLKQQGLQPGVFDYCIPVPLWHRRCPGLWLEMKRTKGGAVSDDQHAFAARMEAFGWRCEVAKGWIAAQAIILDHLSGSEK